MIKVKIKHSKISRVEFQSKFYSDNGCLQSFLPQSNQSPAADLSTDLRTSLIWTRIPFCNRLAFLRFFFVLIFQEKWANWRSSRIRRERMPWTTSQKDGHEDVRNFLREYLNILENEKFGLNFCSKSTIFQFYCFLKLIF